MDEENPYASPTSPLFPTENEPRRGRPARTSDGTVLPRHMAAIVDNFFAIAMAIAAARGMGEGWPIVQGIVAALAFLGYYFLFELAISRTPGKLLTGLVIVSVEGGKCTWWKTAIRTGFRIVEVNPLFFAGLPAAISIIFSRNHQRIGDRVAGTLVVPRRRARSKAR